MNIYYVNRNSNLKGPFDIIDSNRQHIIKVGDICLRDTSDGIAFYVVYNSSNSWNSCKVVGFGDNDTLSDIGNTLLFSFDGLSRRKGNIALIKQVRMCFREKVIDDFFCNALDILEYKRDFWEGSLFPQFFASTQELVDRDEQKKSDLSNDTNYYPSIFAKYLSEELLELLINSLNDGNELKEAYQILRTKHPELFRKALMKFLTENPSGTIFDKPADAYVPTEIVKEVEVPKATSRNDRPLVIIESTDNETFETNERIDKFLSEVAREELISIDEEVELAQKIRKGERNALNKLVRANMRVAIGIAKQHLHNGLEFEDLMQEGFLGLIKAAERFDETRGFAFANYAPWWIRRSLSDAIVRNSSLIQFPMNVRILHRKIWDFKVIYEHQNGFFPPVTEIEIAGEDDLDRISFLNSLPNNLSNTCIPCEDYDVYEDVHNDIWEYENNEYNKYYVSSLLARLSKRERNILLRSFGIGVREETLELIGESHGLTRERVRQIREKAISKLRELIFEASEAEQQVDNQSTQEDSTVQTTHVKNIKETQTLKEVRMAFMQVKIDQLAEENSKKSAEYGNVILASSRKDVDMDTCNYSVVNYDGKCNIYDHNKRLAYSSTGNIKEINKSYYRVNLTYSFFSVGLIQSNHEGKFFNGANILLANRQSMLYHKLNCKGFIDLIEDIEVDGRRRVKVDGCWYDERGNEIFTKYNSDFNISEHNDATKGFVEDNHTIEHENPNEIDEFSVEHVIVDTSDAFPYKDVEVEIEQSNEDKVEEEVTTSIWTFAENIRIAKRSKQFLKCKCCVGLSKIGYYLIVNHRYIKLGDYPDGYEYNVGNVWIKKPIDNKGYRIVHDNGKRSHLIGYTIERGRTIVFTNPTNDVYSVSFDGRITSGIKNKKTISLNEIDNDKLRHAFDKKATSYKYFWFLAILKIYNEIRMDSIQYKDILIEMVSIAWKYVFAIECQFPSQDQLPVYLRVIQAQTYLGRSAKEKEVEKTVREHYHEWKWNTLLMPLLNNVPYRFLSPWISFTNNEDVMEKSKKTESRCPYSLAKDCVTINPLWSYYLLENYDKIVFHVEKELRSYLKCK